MIKIHHNTNDLNKPKKEPISKIKENSPFKEDEKIGNEELNINNQNKDNSISIGNKNSDTNKVSDKIYINKIEGTNLTLNKAKTLNSQRRNDRFGNEIFHGGKQKVTFIDKVSKNNFTDVVKVENYKEYNKMEETTANRGNNCCILL